MTSLVPPINAKGVFKLAPPFDQLLQGEQEFTVHAVRNLVELDASEESPFDTIYKPIGLSEAEYQNDLDNNIPIVVFVTDGREYIYIPANRIISIPKINGVKYQEKVLAISLGNIPVDLNLDVVKEVIANDVEGIIGVKSEVKVVNASAVSVIEIDKHNEFKALRENTASVFKSYRTRLIELQELYDKRETIINELEKYIKDNYVEQ
jgi:hypothetical protein